MEDGHVSFECCVIHTLCYLQSKLAFLSISWTSESFSWTTKKNSTIIKIWIENLFCSVDILPFTWLYRFSFVLNNWIFWFVFIEKLILFSHFDMRYNIVNLKCVQKLNHTFFDKKKHLSALVFNVTQCLSFTIFSDFNKICFKIYWAISFR